MCEVCKTDQKCGHPLGAMHGEPRRALRSLRTYVVGSASPPDPTPSTSSTEEPEGATSRGRPIPFGRWSGVAAPQSWRPAQPADASRAQPGADDHASRLRTEKELTGRPGNYS